MQRLKQVLVRQHQKYASRQCAFWLTGVLALLAVITYYMAWESDDMIDGVDIDGHRENSAEMLMDTTLSDEDDDEDNFEDNIWRDIDAVATTGTASIIAAVPNSKNNRKIGRKQDRNFDVDFEDDDKASQQKGHDYDQGESNAGSHRNKTGKKLNHYGMNADDAEYDGERQSPTADTEGNGGDAADRHEQRRTEHTGSEVNSRAQTANDDNKNDTDGPDDDGEAGKDAGEDAEDDDVAKNTDDINGNEDMDEGENAAEDDSGKRYDTCDGECQKFRAQLASWSSDKPKAFIYYLIHRPAMRTLRQSIRSLQRNFNRRYRYPIVVFVEPELDNKPDRRSIADMVLADGESTPTSIYVQVVRFRIPDYVNASQVPLLAGFGALKRTIGYRHMCRFHAGSVYDQPIVRSPGLEYGWRLDDDSLIRRPIDYDVFRVMQDGGYQYGYRRISTGWSPVDYALWDAVDRYLNATPSLTPTFYREWPKNAARYFNNFEVSDLRVWLSPQYYEYFNFVDRLGGIYYYKWGDAAIKTIAVTLFIPRNRTHRFTDIAYSHT